MPKENKEIPVISVTGTTVDTNILIKFINKFDGNRENLTPFLNNCRNAIGLATQSQQDILLKYIISQLEGRAQKACSIKEFESWTQLEDFLKSQFGEKKHYPALISELQNCYQGSSETVNEFGLRVESCLSRLLTEININTSAQKKDELVGRIAAMEDLALHSFIVGLHPNLSTVVRCRDPDTLNEAINFALSEEKYTQTSLKRITPSSYNGPRYTTDRFRRQPPPRDYQFRPNFRNIPNTNPENRVPRIIPMFCRYCKISGHIIDNCRKREYNNKRYGNSFNQQPSTSFQNPGTRFQNRDNPINNIEAEDVEAGHDEIDNLNLNA